MSPPPGRVTKTKKATTATKVKVKDKPQGQASKPKSNQKVTGTVKSEGAVASTSGTGNATKEATLKIFIDNITGQRESVGSVVDFPFEASRCRMLTGEGRLPDDHGGILYWMQRDQRVQDNWAMVYAQRLALLEKVPLFVCFCIAPGGLKSRTLRMAGFMLRGLKLVRQELHDLKIPFYLLKGKPSNVLPDFVKTHQIGGIVSDFSPLRESQTWMKELIKTVPSRVPICEVDAHNIVPLWVTSEKQEYAARTIRPKITKNLSKYLTEFPQVVNHEFNKQVQLKTLADPFENLNELFEYLEVDKSVPEVSWAKPGYSAGLETLNEFLNTKLKGFEKNRNDPNSNVSSNLSPWFNFGQISVARAALEVGKFKTSSSNCSEGAASFIEEAVIRRELSDNFCYYNENYDKIEGAYDWAKETLRVHQKDVRKPLYTLAKFENGETYDHLWNGAQIQMKIEGKMHGFLRMYWAKKILEWSKSPEQALEIAIYLNDKYSLDGWDPNGFVGCMWSICGIHDQGWREREIFGKIRYMNYEGCKRKFNVSEFEEKYKQKKMKLSKK